VKVQITPSEKEVLAYTAKVESTMSLRGISKREFTPVVQLSLRKVLASEFGAHYHYVTISDVSRRLWVAAVAAPDASKSVTFKVTIRTTPDIANTVATSVNTLKDDVKAISALAAKLNQQMLADGSDVRPVTIGAITSAETTTGLQPPAYITYDVLRVPTNITTNTTTTMKMPVTENPVGRGHTSAAVSWPLTVAILSAVTCHTDLAGLYGI